MKFTKAQLDRAHRALDEESETFLAELESLQREGAMYVDHWIEPIRDFRHVRIRLTDDEAAEYYRRTIAFGLFLADRKARWAREVSGIDADIAADADAYVSHDRNGHSEGPPFHCHAGFLGGYLESVVCTDLRHEPVELLGKEALVFTIYRAVESLKPVIRAVSRREKGLARWEVRCEDDVRDLLYAMLRPASFDLVTEEAIPKRAGKHKFVDLCSAASRTLIEIKWIGRRGRWPRILDQIHVDTQTYPQHPACDTLIFVIVDAAQDIPDPYLIEKQLSGKQRICDRTVDVRVLVTEP